MMTLVERIAHEIATDDIDQSDRLARTYAAAADDAKAVADDLFACLCGYSLKTMIGELEKPDEYDEDEDAKACALLDLSQPCDLPRYVIAPCRWESYGPEDGETVQCEPGEAEFWGGYVYPPGTTQGDAERTEERKTAKEAADLAQRLADENGGVYITTDPAFLDLIRSATWVEVQPCRETGDGVDRAFTEGAAEFWGVYVRAPDGDELATHLFDVATRARAVELANRIACGLPVEVKEFCAED